MVVAKEKLSRVSTLKCSACDLIFSVDQINTFASCDNCQKSPLLVQYDLRTEFKKENINTQKQSMWRYTEMLPVHGKKNIVSLGEGWTPLFELENLAKRYEMDHLMMKDESQNPTGSFKARGLSVAVSKARELGVETCIVPTAGNAGGAVSAYCAKAGMKSIVVMPRHTPDAFKKECQMFGAELILVDGLISDCARKVAAIKKERDCFDMSTMKEPYRLEGKKTMGYEIAEQLSWKLPDVILYPTGGGTGLIGIWKAFYEMRELGWIDSKLPRMIAVQSENCCPVVQTYKGLQKDASMYQGKATIANGLAVPNPFAEKLILQTIHESGGTAVAVSDEEIVKATREVAALEGMLIAPEGAALIPALTKLLNTGEVSRDEKILLLNTGSGYKYLENL